MTPSLSGENIQILAKCNTYACFQTTGLSTKPLQSTETHTTCDRFVRVCVCVCTDILSDKHTTPKHRNACAFNWYARLTSAGVSINSVECIDTADFSSMHVSKPLECPTNWITKLCELAILRHLHCPINDSHSDQCKHVNPSKLYYIRQCPQIYSKA